MVSLWYTSSTMHIVKKKKNNKKKKNTWHWSFWYFFQLTTHDPYLWGVTRGLSKGVGVIQENGRKTYLKRWKGEEKLLQKYKHLSDVFAHTWDNRGMKGSEGSKAGNRRQNILTTLSPQFVCHSSFHVTTLSKHNLADTQIYKYRITGKFLFINNN